MKFIDKMENQGIIIIDQETYTNSVYDYLFKKKCKEFNVNGMPEAKFNIRVESKTNNVIFNYHNFPAGIINELVKYSNK